MTAYARHAPIAHLPWPGGSSAEEPYEQPAPRRHATYVCTRGHTFTLTFAATAEVPPTWDHTCGAPARLEGAPEGTEGSAPLTGYHAVGSGRYERSCDTVSPRAQLGKRRRDAELEATLNEALADLRQRRAGAR